jgi:hypothetical protein
VMTRESAKECREILAGAGAPEDHWPPSDL